MSNAEMESLTGIATVIKRDWALMLILSDTNLPHL